MRWIPIVLVACSSKSDAPPPAPPPKPAAPTVDAAPSLRATKPIALAAKDPFKVD